MECDDWSEVYFMFHECHPVDCVTGSRWWCCGITCIIKSLLDSTLMYGWSFRSPTDGLPVYHRYHVLVLYSSICLQRQLGQWTGSRSWPRGCCWHADCPPRPNPATFSQYFREPRQLSSRRMSPFLARYGKKPWNAEMTGNDMLSTNQSITCCGAASDIQGRLAIE